MRNLEAPSLETLQHVPIYDEVREGARMEGLPVNEVVAEAMPGRREQEVAELSANGITLPSNRVQIAQQPDTKVRGGIGICYETDPLEAALYADEGVLPVTSPEDAHGVATEKAVVMDEKWVHINKQPTPIVEIDDNQGVKGNLYVTLENGLTLEQMRLRDPEEYRWTRDQFFAQYAEAHGLDPYLNRGATDYGTFGADMDAIAQYLVGRYGKHAAAAASGASEAFGGNPNFQNERTGRGAIIGLRAYLDVRRATDPALRHIFESGGKLDTIVEGNGKAISPTTLGLPHPAGLKGLTEMHGAMRAKRGHLDPRLAVDLARVDLLGEKTPGLIKDMNLQDDIEWFPASDIEEFWATTSANLILAGAKEYTQTRRRVQLMLEASKYLLAVEYVANKPATPAGQREWDAAEVDTIVEAVANIGGTAGSELMGQVIMHGADIKAADAQWNQIMESNAKDVFRQNREHRAEAGGNFVPISTTTNRIYARGLWERRMN